MDKLLAGMPFTNTDAVFKDEIPKCDLHECGGVVKPGQ